MNTDAPDDLGIVLTFSSSLHGDNRHGLARLRGEGREQEARLDALERRLLAHVPLRDAPAAPEPERPRLAVAPTSSWEELVEAGSRHLSERGTDPTAVDLASRLNADEVNELRWASDLPGDFSCRLDLLDVATSVVAGLVATVVDITVVRVPRTMRFHGTAQKGSPITALLREMQLPADNWLAEFVKVPFDGLGDGMTPRSHRIDTFGHDPLFGLVLGTIDILRGTKTGIGSGNDLVVTQVSEAVTENPLVAVVLEVGHLLSDVVTKAGLPLPGSALLRTLAWGNIDGQTIGELTRQMYQRGCETRHLATMSTSAGAAELLLWSAWTLRRHFDAEWADITNAEERITRAETLHDHPRFVMMELIAHAIAAIGNVGKIALLEGNPLAFNYAQWVRLSKVIGTWWSSQARRPTDLLAVRSDINLERLLDGWPLAHD